MTSKKFDLWYEALAGVRQSIWVAMQELAQRLDRGITLPNPTSDDTGVSKFQGQTYDSDGSDESDESDDSNDSDDEKKPTERKPAPQVKKPSPKDTTAKKQTSSSQPTANHVHHYHNYVFNVSKESEADYLLDRSLKKNRMSSSSATRKPAASPRHSRQNAT